MAETGDDISERMNRSRHDLLEQPPIKVVCSSPVPPVHSEEIVLGRFIPLFRKVWEKIPPQHAEKLYAEWKRRQSDGVTPWICLDHWMDSGVRGCVGCSDEFRIGLNDFMNMPDDAAMFLIAHELAHLYQSAQGVRPAGGATNCAYFHDADGHLWGGTQDREGDADRIARSWGFSQAARDALDCGGNDSPKTTPGQTLFYVDITVMFEIPVYADSKDDAEKRAGRMTPAEWLKADGRPTVEEIATVTLDE